MFLLDVPVTTDAVMWAAIVGFLSPPVIQFITSAIHTRQGQAVAAFAFCLAAAVPTAYFGAQLTVGDYIKSALFVFTLAMTSYKTLWNPLGVTPSTGAPSPDVRTRN